MADDYHHPCTWRPSWFPLLSLILLVLPCATVGARSLFATPLSPPALALPFALHPTAASLSAARAARNRWSRVRAEETPGYRQCSLTAGYSVTIQVLQSTLEVTQGQILSQSPTDATSSR